MKPLRIVLVVIIGSIVVFGVYWRSQNVSDAGNNHPKVEKEELDEEVKDVLSEAESMAHGGDFTGAADILREKANTLEAGYEADELRLNAIQYRVIDYVHQGSAAAPLEQLAAEIVDQSSPSMKEMAHIVAGEIYAFTGEYDEGQRILNKYLEEHPPLSEEEVQQYRQIRRQSSSTSEEDDSEKPPRTLHRHSAKRLLKKMEMVGEDAPDFEVKALDGSSLSPADYQGRTLLLHFWSTSTESSRQQVEDMESVYRDYHEEGLEIVGLSLDEDRESLESFVSDSEIQWKQVLLNGNEQQEIPNLYGVDSIPQAVLIGPRGQVRACGRSLLGRGLERNVQSVLGSSHQ